MRLEPAVGPEPPSVPLTPAAPSPGADTLRSGLEDGLTDPPLLVPAPCAPASSAGDVGARVQGHHGPS